MSRWPFDEQNRRVPLREIIRRIKNGEIETMGEIDLELAKGIMASRRIGNEVRRDVERLKKRLSKQPNKCNERTN